MEQSELCDTLSPKGRLVLDNRSRNIIQNHSNILAFVAVTENVYSGRLLTVVVRPRMTKKRMDLSCGNHDGLLKVEKGGKHNQRRNGCDCQDELVGLLQNCTLADIQTNDSTSSDNVVQTNPISS